MVDTEKSLSQKKKKKEYLVHNLTTLGIVHLYIIKFREISLTIIFSYLIF